MVTITIMEQCDVFMSFSIDNHNGHCKDQFCLEPKTGMDSGPKSPNNKFVESERKS